MKILALDSTARVASVAICDGERPLAEYNIDNGLTQSELLLPMAEAAVKNLGISLSDIDLFAVTVRYDGYHRSVFYGYIVQAGVKMEFTAPRYNFIS